LVPQAQQDRKERKASKALTAQPEQQGQKEQLDLKAQIQLCLGQKAKQAKKDQ
jgi:hypothetical protein